jgi:nondiscriminating aspartyl-tRNA synthetase
MNDMKRTLIADLPEAIGQEVRISGWVTVRRDQGKLVFFKVCDRSGSVQAVVLPDTPELVELAQTLKLESAITIQGEVKERPNKTADPEDRLEFVEIAVTGLEILGAPTEDLTIDVSQADMGLQLDTLLNNRTLSLRNGKINAIFTLYDLLLAGYEKHMRKRDFVEIKTPKILGSATEGGANFFKINYFDRSAYLAQSPQFYKQAGMSAFERVFEIGTVFRAEPHFTTRHVNEYTGLDAEMGFIDSVEDVMQALEDAMFAMFQKIDKKGQKQLALYGATVPEYVAIPRMRLADALTILKEKYNKEVEDEDIDSEGERLICEYVKEEYGSDLVFLTHYPTHIRPFYSMPSPDNKEYTETFDLLFRGVEIASGGQRIHDPEMLIESIKAKGLNPEEFEDYIEIFRLGVPPHGGWGLGSERILQKILNLGSIKEAVLYPRDVKRLAP